MSRETLAESAADERCECGKTPEEHGNTHLLSWHHWWYFHPEPLVGCRYCGIGALPGSQNVRYSVE